MCIFTMQESSHKFFKIKGELDFEKNKEALFMPHDGQIIAIFRIFGIGYK